MGSPESLIWSELYFLPHWQNFIDIFNSVPIILIALACGIYFKKTTLSVIAISMALHVLLDLPLHHDDAHRHFFPLTDWRYMSPVSYWDPRHHGDIMKVVQIAVVAFGLIVLWIRHPNVLEKTIVACLGIGYVMFQIFVLVVWSG